jgi:hypothetical protein
VLVISSLINRIDLVADLINGIIDDLDAIGLPPAFVAKGTLTAVLAGTKLAGDQVEGMEPLVVGALTPYERAALELEFSAPSGEPPPMPARTAPPAPVPTLVPRPGTPPQVRSLRDRLKEATPLPAPATGSKT